MMSALSAGMGAGALIPSIISLVMNPGSPHQLFSVAAFYWIAAALMALALLAVLVLDYSGAFPNNALADKDDNTDTDDGDDRHEASTTPLLSHDTSRSINALEIDPSAGPEDASRWQLWLHMAVLCWGASLIFGWQPGLVPYMMPNGHPLVVFQIAGQVRETAGDW